jgi:hypothetical protein
MHFRPDRRKQWFPRSLLAGDEQSDLMADVYNIPGRRPIGRTEDAAKAARRPANRRWASESDREDPVELLEEQVARRARSAAGLQSAALMGTSPTGERVDPGLVRRLHDPRGL